jgi:hypothetical protein
MFSIIILSLPCEIDDMKKSKLIYVLPNLLFCLVVVLAFRYNSYLRPGPIGALYKEYIVGGLVLALCYLNYLVLYPIFYVKRRLLIYVSLTILSLLTFSLAEEILVFPQIYEIVHQLDINLNLYFAEQTVLILLRNFCFVVFFFSLSTICFLRKEKSDIYHYLHNHNHLVVAKDSKNNTVTIHLEDIAYCQQVENYAYMILSNGKQYSRNCTMSALFEDLGTECSLRISRNIIAMYSYIQSYDQNAVYIITHEGIKGFCITKSFRKNAIAQLKKHSPVVDYSFESPDNKELSTAVNDQSLDDHLNTDNDRMTANSDNVGDNQTSQQILSYIREHPDCKSSDLTGQFHISLSTVNRILKQLKAEGLITYEGSKKTGGYRAVSS